MKIKYLIPFIGMYFIYQDIPMTESQQSYKPLQGEAAFVMMVSNAIISLLTLVCVLSNLKLNGIL